jgi:hypothetical protein
MAGLIGAGPPPVNGWAGDGIAYTASMAAANTARAPADTAAAPNALMPAFSAEIAANSSLRLASSAFVRAFGLC